MAEALTAEVVLGTTEDDLRRFGPAKATIVDVARALGVSHGSVYRRFPTKAALREAVTQRRLDRAHAGLSDVAASDTPPPQRLRAWLGPVRGEAPEGPGRPGAVRHPHRAGGGDQFRGRRPPRAPGR